MKLHYADTPQPPSRTNLDIHRRKCLRCAKAEPHASNPDYLCRVGQEHLRDFLLLQEVYDRFQSERRTPAQSVQRAGALTPRSDRELYGTNQQSPLPPRTRHEFASGTRLLSGREAAGSFPLDPTAQTDKKGKTAGG